MTTVNDIYSFLNEFCPFDTALSFDNAGLLIGSKNDNVTSAVVALDCTKSAAEKAINNGAQLIITHHPVIFSGLKSIPSDSIYALLLKNGINVISAHTNLDAAKGGVNDCLCAALGLKDVSPLVSSDSFPIRVGFVGDEMTPKQFAVYARELLGFSPRFCEGSAKIRKVAVCGGAGGDYITDAAANGCDALLTGEIKHHQYILAENLGITAVDCGHFATEDTVIEPLAAMLKENFPNINFITDHHSAVKCFRGYVND